MIECEHCGSRHRTQEAVDACGARAERRAAREAAKLADRVQRARNHATRPPATFIRESLTLGIRWVNIISGLNKSYFPPEGKKKWDLVSVIELDSQRLKWPEGEWTWPKGVIGVTELLKRTGTYVDTNIEGLAAIEEGEQDA